MAASRWNTDYKVYQKYLRTIALLYRERRDVKMYLELFLTVFTLIFFGMFALRPSLTTIGKLLAEQKGKRETIKQMDAKILELGEAKKIYDEEKSNLAFLDNAIPTNPSSIFYLQQIYQIALENNVFIRVLSVKSSPVKLPEIQKLNQPMFLEFSLFASGNYTNLLSFIKSIEDFRRPAIITNINTTSDVLETNQGGLSMTIEGKTLYFY